MSPTWFALPLLAILAAAIPLQVSAQGVVGWDRAAYPPNSYGILQISDRDMSMNPMTISTFQTSVWSSSDLGGIRLEMVETSPGSGVFTGHVYFSTNYPSSANRLHVTAGDTVTAQYVDRTLPPPYLESQEIIIRATALISSNSTSQSASPPSACGYSLDGRLLYGPNSCPPEGTPTIISQAVQIPPDVADYLMHTDEQYYMLMLSGFKCTGCQEHPTMSCVYGPNGTVAPTFTGAQMRVLLDLHANYSFPICPFYKNHAEPPHPSVPPRYESPRMQAMSGVPPDKVQCVKGLELVIRAEDGSPACVTPSTAARLLSQGWARIP